MCQDWEDCFVLLLLLYVGCDGGGDDEHCDHFQPRPLLLLQAQGLSMIVSAAAGAAAVLPARGGSADDFVAVAHVAHDQHVEIETLWSGARACC